MESLLFEQLHQRFNKAIYRYIFKRVKRHEIAQELTQDVFLRIKLNLHTYDSIYPLPPWIWMIVKNLMIDYYVKHRNIRKFKFVEIPTHLTQELRTYALDPEVTAIWKDYKELLYEALDELCYKQNKVLKMRLIDDLSYKEIAFKMETTEIAIKAIINRATTNITHLMINKH